MAGISILFLIFRSFLVLKFATALFRRPGQIQCFFLIPNLLPEILMVRVTVSRSIKGSFCVTKTFRTDFVDRWPFFTHTHDEHRLQETKQTDGTAASMYSWLQRGSLPHLPWQLLCIVGYRFAFVQPCNRNVSGWADTNAKF